MHPSRMSKAQRIAALPDKEREEFFESLSTTEQEQLLWDWKFWGRPDQFQPDGDWRAWMILAGRGWGKTRTGAEWVHEMVRTKTYGRFHLMGATAADVRDVMVEGESGLLATSPPWEDCHYSPTKRRITWGNGAVATLFSADEPERLRGPQCEAAWCDELAAWRYPMAWTQLQLGLRLGRNPRSIITTTPRPTPLVKSLIKAPTTYVTKGTTYDNMSNLADAFTDEIIRVYEGTRLGRQELMAEILDDVPGALWRRRTIDATRVAPRGKELFHEDDQGNMVTLRQVPGMVRVVVAIDPAVSLSKDASETGIMVVGKGEDGHGYLLEDLSGRFKPEQWASIAIKAYHKYEADRIIAERNQGGDMIESTIRVVDTNVPVKLVRASKGKHTRAEPVAALYERGEFHHVGSFPDLEDQQCTWEPGDDSPDRLDALVWGATELMLGRQTISVLGMVSNPLGKSSYWRQ